MKRTYPFKSTCYLPHTCMPASLGGMKGIPKMLLFNLSQLANHPCHKSTRVSLKHKKISAAIKGPSNTYAFIHELSGGRYSCYKCPCCTAQHYTPFPWLLRWVKLKLYMTWFLGMPNLFKSGYLTIYLHGFVISSPICFHA